MNTYGKCPQCGTDSISRERRPNGNDKCANGHTYPSANAIQSHSGEAELTSLKVLAEIREILGEVINL